MKVFGSAMILSFILLAAVFDDFSSGALLFQNGDWVGAIKALEQVEPEDAQYDSAQALLRVVRQKQSEAVSDTLPVAGIDTSAETLAEVRAPQFAAETELPTPSSHYSLSNDGSPVYISSSRDWWDDAHLRAVVPPGTGAILLEEQRIEDVPGFVLKRCRVRTTSGRQTVGWIFCDDLRSE